MAPLRLPGSVREVFFARLEREFPDRIKKLESFIRSIKEGALNRSEFFERFEGHGSYWSSIQSLFEIQCRKLGLNQSDMKPRPKTFRRPGELFAQRF